MTVEIPAQSVDGDVVIPRVVQVDGIPMSALCVEVEQPRAVVLAVHGGATMARYFDCPGHPSLSLLRERGGPGLARGSA